MASRRKTGWGFFVLFFNPFRFFMPKSPFFLQPKKTSPPKKTQPGLPRADAGAFYKYPKSKWTPKILFDINFRKQPNILMSLNTLFFIKILERDCRERGTGCPP